MIKSLYILVFSALLLSCATQKKVSTKESESYEVTALFLDALKEKLINNYEKAIELLKKAEELSPKNAAIKYELSQIYTYKGSFSYAVTYAEKAAELDPENKWYLLQLAYLYKSNSLHKEALTTFEKLYDLEPSNLTYAFSLADAYLYVGEAKKAIEIINEVEAQIGINEDLSYQKRDLYLKMGDKKNALKSIQALVDAFPEEPMHIGALAETYQMIGDDEKAFENYQKLLDIDPTNGIAHFSLFQLYAKQQKEDEAIASLKKAFLSDDVSIDLKIDVMLKMYEMNTQSYNKSSYELLEIMTQIHPEDAKTYSIYGDFLNRDRRIKEAVKKYQKAVELDNSKYTIWNQILVLEAQANDFEGMIKDSEKALELFPSQPSFYLFNGLANLQEKNYEKAIESLNSGRLLLVDDKLVEAQFYQYLGEAYHKVEDHKNSDKYYDKYLNIDPNNATVLNNYSYYLSLRKENLSKAETMISKADKMYPNNPTFLDTYGWVLYQQGKYAEAKEKLKRALDNGGSSSAEVLEHYGDALFQLGMKDEALNYWNKALEKEGHSDKLQQKINAKNLLD